TCSVSTQATPPTVVDGASEAGAGSGASLLLFDPLFDPGLVAKLYPQSPFAAGVGSIAHELVHELQRLANTAYDAEYEEARAIYGAGPDNPFQTFPNALENAVKRPLRVDGVRILRPLQQRHRFIFAR